MLCFDSAKIRIIFVLFDYTIVFYYFVFFFDYTKSLFPFAFHFLFIFIVLFYIFCVYPCVVCLNELINANLGNFNYFLILRDLISIPHHQIGTLNHHQFHHQQFHILNYLILQFLFCIFHFISPYLCFSAIFDENPSTIYVLIRGLICFHFEMH